VCTERNAKFDVESSTHVESLVNIGWNGLDLCAKLLFDLVKVEAIFIGDEVDGKTKMTITARSTNAMQVRFGVLGEIKVDNDIHSLNIDTTSEKIRRDKITAGSASEVVEDAVSFRLLHAGVNVETGIAQLGDILCQQLHTLESVAEDDGLVDAELREERVEAVDLLLFLHKGVVLGDTPESELFHQIDLMRSVQVFVAEVLDRKGEGGGEKKNLAGFLAEANQLFDDGLEVFGKELVSFVEDNHVAVGEIGDVLLGQVENSTGSGNDDVHGLTETNDIVLEHSTTSGDHHLDIGVFAKFLANMGGLKGQFTSGDQN